MFGPGCSRDMKVVEQDDPSPLTFLWSHESITRLETLLLGWDVRQCHLAVVFTNRHGSVLSFLNQTDKFFLVLTLLSVFNEL